MGFRGQASLEYLMIAGFLLVIIGIVFFYSNTTVMTSINDAKARNATDAIAKSIDQVYALGPGSKITLTLDLPNNIESTIIENKLVGYITNVNGKYANYYADTKANLRGTLPFTEGTHQVTLQVNEAGEVIIGEDTIGLIITPKTVTVSLDVNTAYNQIYTYTLWNKNTSAISGISITKSGTMSPYVTVGSYSTTLDANAQTNFNVTITVPNPTPIGTYSGYLQVDSNNGSDRALIQIVINNPVSNPSTCTGTGTCIDTNWQTSWGIFDANMKFTYQLINENTLHWHDGRYYTQAQSDANWNKYILLNADINWIQLQNYPTACPAGQAIKDINKTSFTCIAVGGSGSDTNWQTSFNLLDTNLKTTYPIKSDVNTWGDQRYAPIGTTSIIKVTTADQNTQNSNTSITGLDISLLANKHYGFHCYLTASSNAANVGIQLAMSTPSSPTYFSAKIVGWTSTTVLAYSVVTASDSYQANANSQGTPNYVYEISGAIDNVNAGTLVPRFKSETASNVFIRAGSWCEYTQGA